MKVAVSGEFHVTKRIGLGVCWVLQSRDELKVQCFSGNQVAKEMRSHVNVSLFFVVLCILGGVNCGLVVDVQDGRGHVASVRG